MRHRRVEVAALVMAAILVGCTHAASGQARGTVREYLAQIDSDRTTTVGFDVDDTTLFSTPAFLYAKGRLVPEPPSPSEPADEVKAWREWAGTLRQRQEALFGRVTSPATRLDAWELAQRARFWEDVNTEGGAFSPPKAAMREVVRFHLGRGDQVVFVTARPEGTRETLTAKLREDFGSPSVRLVFTGHGAKAAILRELGITVYYGDSDADMDDAIAGGARAVRVMRSRWSQNDRPAAPGARGESFVLLDSDL